MNKLRLNSLLMILVFFCRNLIDIREILSRLKTFSSFSGLNININKCSMLFMGRNVHEGELIENIKIVDKVKIVGIFFSNDKSSSELKENWEGRLDKIKGIINNWMKRKLSIIGKVQVIKTFVLSQFVYVLQSLSLPEHVLQEVNTIIYRFIWKKDNLDCKAWERVKRSVMSNDKASGGLAMINLIDFQRSFLISWACRLCDGLQADWKFFPEDFFASIGGLSIFNSKIELKNFKGFKDIKSKFWQSVLKAWLLNNKSDDKITSQDSINNNKYITVNRETLFVKTAVNNNILYIKDIMEDENIISYETYRDKVNDNQQCLIDYITIRVAIAKIKHKIIFVPDESYNFQFHNIDCRSINRKKIYNFLLTQERCYCEKVWEKKFNQSLHVSTWENIFKFINETKLQEIQWKILHNIFPTNILLNGIGIKDTEKCEFCGEKDFIEHYFFNCGRIKDLWIEVSQIIFNSIKKAVNLNEKNVLFGIEQDIKFTEFQTTDIQLINNILLIGKLSIIKSKFDNANVKLVFERELLLRQTIADSM